MALSVEEFAATARAWLKERLEPRPPEEAAVGGGDRRRGGVPRPDLRRGAGAAGPVDGVAARALRRRVRRHHLAGGLWRGRPVSRPRAGLPARGGRLCHSRDPRDVLRHRRAHRADHPVGGHRGTASPIRAPVAAGRGAVLPAVLRAGGRVGPGRPGHPGRARRRPVGHQRAEGVELRRPVLRVGRAHRPHRPQHPQARRDDGLHGADGRPRRGGAPHPPDVRRLLVQRGVPDRCAHP